MRLLRAETLQVSRNEQANGGRSKSREKLRTIEHNNPFVVSVPKLDERHGQHSALRPSNSLHSASTCIGEATFHHGNG
jgi:hypothetical protein